ncbi:MULTISPECIES: hypothetical protein [unclassified Coleofasciculus]|uniref:hypothetical protein n=1 Tax=unclassified Coleofasciculus TaxID=2692782 RepID=UPI0018808A1D|nr:MULTISPECIES: hypothetical protein [unclassified Coleofasciculus]MBE9125601.1 hypothetical protein [Coleofasciculus sp. LEGE 07081]MBE9147315.1 hypothetical protein [Coleofasciculus sp. LEGE 07092]
MSFPRKIAYILAGIAAISLIIYFLKELGVPVEVGFVTDVLIGGTAIPLAVLLFQKSSEKQDREQEFIQSLRLNLFSTNERLEDLEKDFKELHGLFLRIEAQKESILERLREVENEQDR